MTTILPEPTDGVPPSADRPSAGRRAVEPPAGQPISGGFFDPLTDEQKSDISRRLAEMFPFAEPGDFWTKDVQPCTPCTDGTSSQLPSSPLEEG